MRKQKSVWFLILGLLVVLAGCGGNGNGGGMAGGMPDPDPDPPAMVTCSDGSTAASQDVCDQRTMAATAAARAMAAKIAPAIADPDGDGEIAGPSLKDTNRPGAVAVFTAADGGAVTVDLDGAGTGTDMIDVLDKDDKKTADATMSVENQFMKQMAAPPALDGFAGSVHERTMDKVTDTLTVYTNVEAAKNEAYQMYYANGSTRADGTIITGIEDNDEGNVITFGADVSTISMRISASQFPSARNQTLTFTDNVATEEVQENEVEGAFHGIPGTYECTAGDCTVGTDNDGNIDMFDGTWTFTPTEAGAKMMVQGVIPDNEFLTFGYWLQATEDDEGETTYGIRTFATGRTPSVAATVVDTTFQGEATYSGKAGGMYVKKTFNDRGVGVATSSGQFTADAALTAYFGGNDIAVNKQRTINGTVTNFSDGGTVIDDMWTVELMKANFGTITDDAPTFSGKTTGDGDWQGQFFGTVVNRDETVEGTDPDTLPSGVAGEFIGHLTNGHVIGAFGATQDKKE